MNVFKRIAEEALTGLSSIWQLIKRVEHIEQWLEAQTNAPPAPPAPPAEPQP